MGTINLQGERKLYVFSGFDTLGEPLVVASIDIGASTMEEIFNWFSMATGIKGEEPGSYGYFGVKAKKDQPPALWCHELPFDSLPAKLAVHLRRMGLDDSTGGTETNAFDRGEFFILLSLKQSSTFSEPAAAYMLALRAALRPEQATLVPVDTRLAPHIFPTAKGNLRRRYGELVERFEEWG